MSLSSHVLDAVRAPRRAAYRSGGSAATHALAAGGRGGHRRRRPRRRLGDAATSAGVHRLVFGSGDYFAAQGATTFYPEVVVVFEVTDADRTTTCRCCSARSPTRRTGAR